MRKDNITDRFRFVLGQFAKDLTVEYCPPGELPNADHLEAGIKALRHEVEIERAVHARLRSEFDRLDDRMMEIVAAQTTGMRGLMMTVGQVVRELSVFRKIMIVSGATSNDQAERLYDKALPAIMELRATMALWRQREGLEIPEFDLDEESRLLEQLAQNPAESRMHHPGDAPETLGEALTEHVLQMKESFDPSLTQERHEREMERDDD